MVPVNGMGIFVKAGIEAALEHMKLRVRRRQDALACKFRYCIRMHAGSTLQYLRGDNARRTEAEYLLEHVDTFTLEQLYAIALNLHMQDVRRNEAIMHMILPKRRRKGGE